MLEPIARHLRQTDRRYDTFAGSALPSDPYVFCQQ